MCSFRKFAPLMALRLGFFPNWGEFRPWGGLISFPMVGWFEPGIGVWIRVQNQNS